MKLLLASLLAGALTATAGMALASSGSLVQFKPKVMPVVVQVNAQGRITDVNPSELLRPKLQQLLRKQLEAWIVKPAEVKGHPIASEFIVEVALRANRDQDGNYNASFVYVKSLPLPFTGPVAWAHINGGLELALIPANAIIPGIPRPVWNMRYDTVGYPVNSIAATRAVRGTASHRRFRSTSTSQTLVTPAAASEPVPVSMMPPEPVQHFVPQVNAGAPMGAIPRSTTVPKINPPY